MNNETLILIAVALVALAIGTGIGLAFIYFQRRGMERKYKQEGREWLDRFLPWMDAMKDAKSQEEREALYKNRPSKQLWD